MSSRSRAPAPRPVSPRRRVSAVAVICLILLPITGPAGGILVAAPDLAHDTGASVTELTWIVGGYVLGLAVGLLPGGAWGDRFGRRRVMQLGLLGYVLCSTWPLFTDTPTQLIAARLVTGIAAGIALPATLSIMAGLYPPGARGRIVGSWNVFVVATGIVGIVGFGALVAVSDWRAAFWLAFGLGIFGLVVGASVPSPRAARRVRMDVPGTVLGAVVVAALVFALVEAPARGWTSPPVLGTFAAVVVGLGLLTAVERSSDHPVLAVGGLGASTTAVLTQTALGCGACYAVVIYIRLVENRSAVVAAAAVVPVALALIPITIFRPARRLPVGSALDHATRAVGATLGIALSGSMIASGYLRETTGSDDVPAAPLNGAARDALVVGVQQAALAGLLLVVLAVVVIAMLLPRAGKSEPAGPRRIDGVVRGPGGAPLWGADVTMLDVSGQRLSTVDTDADGRYRLEPPGSGDYLVVCRAEGLPPHGSLVSLNGADRRHDVTLLPDLHEVSGVVRSESGRPLMGARVTLSRVDGPGEDRTAITDVFGAYRFGDLEAGTYTVTTGVRRAASASVRGPAYDIDVMLS